MDLSRFNDARNPEKLGNTLAALVATGTGRCFLWRSRAKSEGEVAGHKTLVTYADQFRPHPGLIILDATADYASQVQAGGNFRRYSGPPVGYRNLSLTQIEQPARFKEVSRRTSSASLIREHATWVRETVRQHTCESEAVLIVVPKKVAQVIDANRIAPGRRVDVAHWGMGIGSNEYRDCGAVFLFSEFHLPRHAYL